MSRKRSKTHPAAHQPRPARRIHEETPPTGPSASCPTCGAGYHRGRWTWDAPPADSEERTCPACERIATDYPAGVLHVAGEFARSHRDEIVALLRHIEEREREQHPLKRIMAVAEEDPGFSVTVTDAKLAESFGRALKSAYEGRLEHPPTSRDPENLARVHWTRD